MTKCLNMAVSTSPAFKPLTFDPNTFETLSTYFITDFVDKLFFIFARDEG